MKKIYTIILFSLVCVYASAQYTKLLDFNNTNGTQPFGSVILSPNDSVLYGMTNGGGSVANSAGVIFSMNADGSGYLNLHNFTADVASGSWPYGSLIRSGNSLYGMTSGYGQYSAGTIFTINTNGSGYTKLYDFTGANGGNPNGTLTISGNILYGMTYGLAGPNKGNIFSIHTDGSNYTDLHEFNGTDGSKPGYGALTLSGNKLFGTTLYGGANGLGVIFSMDTNGTNYTKLLDFNTANGELPFGAVILSGNRLYGTAGGGTYAKGVVFSIHTDGTGYTKLFDFNGTNGQGPMGSLILSGNTLYGTTGGGGANNFGTIFSIDTTSSGFQTLFSFNTPDGTQPRAALSRAGNILYGTGVAGGAYGDGVVFSLETHPAAVPICMVTVDDSSKYNHVVWEKPVTTSIDSFIILREITTNNYKQIGAVPYSALSEFIDTVRIKYFPFTGDPNSGTYRYKLQFRDSGGVYSTLSPYHNTIFVNQTGGTFSWNQYSIEGEAIPVPFLTAYVLYRDDNSTGSWHAIQGVSGTQTSVTDPNYASFPNGSWRIESTWSISCTSIAKTTYSGSKSNINPSFSTGIKELLSGAEIGIYPNPSSGSFTIQTNTSKVTSIEIFNMMGERIQISNGQYSIGNNSQIKIDISKEPEGVYSVRMKTNAGMINKKVLVIK